MSWGTVCAETVAQLGEHAGRLTPVAFNPFTDPASEMSGLNDARVHLQTEYIQVL